MDSESIWYVYPWGGFAVTRDAYINHEKGIHARVAAMIVQKARELEESYEVRIYLKYGKKAEIPATNMMPLVSLQIKKRRHGYRGGQG